MIIGKYRVKWGQAGWSFAKPYVQEKRSFYGLFEYWKTVWESPHTDLITAETMHKKDMVEWFEKAIKEYEEFKKSWS